MSIKQLDPRYYRFLKSLVEMFKINCSVCLGESIVISRPVTDLVICPLCGNSSEEKQIIEIHLDEKLSNPLYAILIGENHGSGNGDSEI